MPVKKGDHKVINQRSVHFINQNILIFTFLLQFYPISKLKERNENLDEDRRTKHSSRNEIIVEEWRKLRL